MNEKELDKAVAAPSGLVDGVAFALPQPGGPDEIPVPPLYRPVAEFLTEKLSLPGGKVRYRVSLAISEAQCGPIKIHLKPLAVVRETKDAASTALGKLVSYAVAQAYHAMLASGDEDQVHAARSMEIGRKRL